MSYEADEAWDNAHDPQRRNPVAYCKECGADHAGHGRAEHGRVLRNVQMARQSFVGLLQRRQPEPSGLHGTARRMQILGGARR